MKKKKPELNAVEREIKRREGIIARQLKKIDKIQFEAEKEISTLQRAIRHQREIIAKLHG